jgi:hypothetical protein
MLVFQFLAWDRHKNVEELNRLMGSQTSLITGSPKDNADINKRLIKEITTSMNLQYNPL